MTRSTLLLATVSSAALLLAQPATAENPASLTVGGGAATGEVLGAAEISGVTFTAGPGETRELVFPDGTSIVMSEGSSFTIQRYSFSPADGTGEMRLSLGPGFFKISGGELNTTSPIVLSSGGAQVRLDNAGAVVEVGADGGIRTYMTVGKSVTLAAGGSTETLRRTGFQTSCTCNGDTPASPIRMTGEDYSADLAALRPKGGAVRTESVAASSELATSGTKLAGTSGGASQNPASRVAQDAQQETSTPIVDTLAAIIANDQDTGTGTDGSSNQQNGNGTNAGSGTNGSGGNTGSGGGGSNPGTGGGGGNPDPGGGNPVAVTPFDRSVFSTALLDAQGTSNTEIQIDNTILLGGYSSTNYRNGTAGGGGGYSSRSNRIYSNESKSVSLNDNQDTVGVIAASLTSFGRPQYLYVSDYSEIPFSDYLSSSGIDVQSFVDIAHSYRREGGVVLYAGGSSNSFIFRFPNPTISTGVSTYFESVDTPIGSIPVQRVNQLQEGFQYFENENFYYAAGVVDGSAAEPDEIRVDRFFSTPNFNGLNGQVGENLFGGARGVATGSRAFLRPGSFFADALSDPGVLVVYRTAENRSDITEFPRDAHVSGSEIGQLLHADFGLAGTGADQGSTLSVTAGSIEQYSFSFGSGEEAFVDAVTVGTERKDGESASIHVNSRYYSTVSGGGNPNLAVAGAPGYFVLENFDPLDEEDNRGGSKRGGIEEPLGGANDSTRFANLRLLSATGSLENASDITDNSFGTVNLDRRTGEGRHGFAAGLSEFEFGDGDSPIGVAIADGFTTAGLVASNFSFTPDPEASTLSADLRLSDPTGAPYEVTLGGTNGKSAFIDNDTFGAVVSGDADFGFVTGNMITVDPDNDGIRSLPGMDTISSTAGSPFLGENLNQFEDTPHLSWGLFLGDRIWDPETGRREHIHLGSWVAGNRIDESLYLNFEGTVAYEGHALGNVYDGTSVSTVVGRFHNSWDFGRSGEKYGAGHFALDFDGQLYTGSTSFKSDQGFVSTDLASSQGRAGRIDGEFYGVPGSNPTAVGGQFGLSGTNYLAAGTFAGGSER